MRKYVYFLLLSAVVYACSDSENENNIQDLTVSEHIELIKNHDNKIEISFDDLPDVSQSYINSLENNITTEQILHAQDIGYEVKIKRESRSLVSLLNILYIYFDQDGDFLLDDNYDEDGDGEYDIYDEWENFMCFDIQFPVSVTMPDESQITIENEDELYEAAESYYEMSEEYDGLPEINFPINIIFYYEGENGNEIEEVVGVSSQDELDLYFEICEDGWYDEDWGWDEMECVELVYPISIENPESEIITVESENELYEYIDQYYQNCNSDDCYGEFELVFPLTIEYYSENNDQTQILTISSQEELDEYLEEYCNHDIGDDSDDWHVDNECGEIIYPLTIQNSNGDQITGNNEEELQILLEEWWSNNCNSIECNSEFEIVFPITMQYENEQGEIIVMTIQSEEILEEITEQYCGD